MTIPNILIQMVEDKKKALVHDKTDEPLESFSHKIEPSQRDFYQALQHNRAQQRNSYILECKKASPSKGLIREHFDLKNIAQTYRSFATVISVLTDEKYFQGSFDYLTVVSENTSQPILCKDFIIDEYQIYRARYHQADAILLMLSILNDEEYIQLAEVAHSLNMGILTEVISEEELERAIRLKAKVVGINNRDLRDLSINTNRTKTLAPLLPNEIIVISESGIYRHAQINALEPYVDGFLIGSALMAENDLERALKALIFGAHKVCGLTRIEDALAANEAGAIYGGLIFAPHSPRYVSPEKAKKIAHSAALKWVGVFVNESQKQVVERCKDLALFAVQLHGNEDSEYIHELKKQLHAAGLTTEIWQALSIQDAIPPMNEPFIDRYVLDNAQGGSGKTFDWSLLANIPLDNVLIAGGINGTNLKKALALKASGLDLNSGVEASPGIKCPQKIKVIFSTIRQKTITEEIGNKMKPNDTLLPSYFGEFGGQYVPQVLMPALRQLEKAFVEAMDDPAFTSEFHDLLKNYAGRPTPLTLCRNLTEGSKTKLYLKREDLLHGGAHKTNQVLGQALLAKRMGKKEIIAETGAGQHGVATALACALLGLKCRIYMGAKDIERQSPNVFRMRLMGAEVIPVHNGSATLKSACNEALRDWSATYKDAHYLLGTAAGPHPFPTIVREFQRMIGAEAKAQLLEREGRLPDAVIACVGGGSNAIGLFADFIDEKSVKLIGVEPAGLGIETGQHGAPLKYGKVGIYFGMKSPLMQTDEGQICDSYSISAGLDFPSAGPQHAHLSATGRADYVNVTDEDALEAFQLLSLKEGIIPALESSHALAYAMKMIKEHPETEQILVVNISGRGDKDIFTVFDILKERGLYA